MDFDENRRKRFLQAPRSFLNCRGVKRNSRVTEILGANNLKSEIRSKITISLFFAIRQALLTHFVLTHKKNRCSMLGGLATDPLVNHEPQVILRRVPRRGRVPCPGLMS